MHKLWPVFGIFLLILVPVGGAEPDGDPMIGSSWASRGCCNDRVRFDADGACALVLNGCYRQGSWRRQGQEVRCRLGPVEVLCLRQEGEGWFDGDDQPWVALDTLRRRPEWTTRSVRFRLQLAEGCAPDPEAGLVYDVRTTDEKADPLLLEPLRPDADGIITIDLPVPCDFDYRIIGPLVPAGYGSYKGRTITAADVEAGEPIELVMRTGRRVPGRVVDAVTGEPVAGAEVAPVVFTPPGTSADRQHRTWSDIEGRFSVAPLNVGIYGDMLECQHPDYWRGGSQVTAEMEEVIIELQQGGRISGRVVDAEGAAVAGAELVDYHGKRTRSNNDGRFELVSIGHENRELTRITIRHPDFTEQIVQCDPHKDQQLEIVLENRPLLIAEVVDLAGEAMTHYRLAVSCEPYPGSWNKESITVEDGRAAQVAVTVRSWSDAADPWWVGIDVPGSGLHEFLLSPWQGVHRQRFVCRPGHPVTLQLGRTGEELAGSELRLQPIGPPRGLPVGEQGHILAAADYDRPMNGDVLRRSWGEQSASIDRQGLARFAGVQPGLYDLVLDRPGLPTLRRGLWMTTQPLQLDWQLPVTGSVRGRVRRRDGAVYAYAPLTWTAGLPESWAIVGRQPTLKESVDDAGRFSCDSLPLGRNFAGVRFNASVDMISEFGLWFNLVPGEVTELDLQMHDDGAVPLRFTTATGAVPERLYLRVEPLADIATSWSGSGWCRPAQGDVFVHIATPGRWRLRVDERPNFRRSGSAFQGVLAVTQAHVAGAEALTVALPGGAITGQIIGEAVDDAHIVVQSHDRDWYRLIASGEDGRFHCPWLPPGNYRVGWPASWRSVTVGDGVVDCGRLDAMVESAVLVDLRPTRAGWLGGEVVAIADGIERSGWQSGADPLRWRLGQLGPGNWRLVYRCDGEEIAATTVSLPTPADEEETVVELGW